MTDRRRSVAGMVLTGGASRRMGTEKTLIPIEGEACITRIERALRSVAFPCIEVGPGRSTFPSIVEPAPGNGPLTAIAAGTATLRAMGHDGPVLVIAGDLPLVTAELLGWLAEHSADGSVVPVVNGRRQPLLARWSPSDLERAVDAAGRGYRSLCDLPDLRESTDVAEAMWSSVATAVVFSDIDTPEDLRLLQSMLGSAAAVGT